MSLRKSKTKTKSGKNFLDNFEKLSANHAADE